MDELGDERPDVVVLPEGVSTGPSRLAGRLAEAYVVVAPSVPFRAHDNIGTWRSDAPWGPRLLGDGVSEETKQGGDQTDEEHPKEKNENPGSDGADGVAVTQEP